MNTLKIYSLLAFLSVGTLTFSSCSKDDPQPEVDQEEISNAQITFTEVERELHGDHYHYHDVPDGFTETITFDGSFVPSTDHFDLEEGKTYKMEVATYNFQGQESQQVYIERADIHQAGIFGFTGNDENNRFDLTEHMEFDYGDAENARVGITGYITVTEHSDSFNFQYRLFHLQTGAKEGLTADDWNDFSKLSNAGSTDISLVIPMHFVHGGDDHDHDH
ncbi:hypothetical protein H8S90_13350 [Olivibacter sp. SDN3]|uniref:hypothetical protein n=1 Tax=Olivibacter sp. SDN3 TaxID=2764720 RepID=UPI001650DCFE|nr:hypothetical protein [Olivibacter sp. SDN3]QNL47807.1 hypothetical protein H8S90_13350 [Olivibacter sp. SDN3]